MLNTEYPKMIEEQHSPKFVKYEILPEKGGISSGLDYYKPTMSQLAYEQEPEAEVTFTFHNRGNQRLLDYVDVNDLQQRFTNLQTSGWNAQEINYLASIRTSDNQRVFSEEYLNYLQTHDLPTAEIKYDDDSDDIAIETTGPWALSTFWETIVMSELNEAYFEGYLKAHELNPFDVSNEGDRRLSQKVDILRSNSNIKFADFGTRRHFSFDWQKHVVERLIEECSENIIGTSNVALAEGLGIKPIGTFAHEMPMVYAGLADARGENIRDSHNRFLQDWFNRYGEDYSIALTDTFKTDFFFSDFTTKQAETWRGVRQDSGDPYKFAEQLVEFYQLNGIDSRTKTVVFSDGLDIEAIVALQKHFEGRINILFGWGTTLTNDLGINPLNVVMKATHVKLPNSEQQADTVKLSDNPGKNSGPPDLVKAYEEHYFAINQEESYGN